MMHFLDILREYLFAHDEFERLCDDLWIDIGGEG